jgi:DNA-binding FrmR family transcriptional regulator
MNRTEKLLELKAEIDKAKIRAAELHGRHDGLMKQLNDDWACKDIAQAEKKVKAMEEDIASLSEKIEKGVAEIESKYEL